MEYASDGRVTPLQRLRLIVRRIREPKTLVVVLALFAIIGTGAIVRIHFSGFLDPFEDGYQNWWISANLASTGQYWDRHSMMTQGNWLPLYHFFGSGVLEIAGLRSMSALKDANIALSTLTSLLVFFVARKRGPLIALAATSFFTFNFIDVVVSGWATGESLATFLVLLGYAMLFQFNGIRSRRFWIAGIALALAVMVRYEAWLVVGLLIVFLLFARRCDRTTRTMFVTILPALAFMLGYFAYSTQWGFLPSIIINQTSTDLRYQLSIGTQPTPAAVLGRWWTGYVGFFPLVLPMGAGYSMLRFRRDFGSWIVVALWGFVTAYTLVLFGNPSFRYVMISVPFLSLFAAFALASVAHRLGHRGHQDPAGKVRRTLIVTLAGAVLLSATLFPSMAASWGPGFPTSQTMEPLVRAGEYVSTLALPGGKILVSESPIAAYFSGYPPDRILGSRWLPENRSAALAFLKSTTAYLIYMGVPYYKLRVLFPEMQNGATTVDFELLYDAGGTQAGTHAVFVYRMRP
jgi:4-amino-4-deoxy-L-arabinose transferase-like glycosyltransferase